MFNPQTVSRLTYLWCGVLLLTSVGCQTYSPYGYGSYPGSYGAPVYQQPGQPIYGSPGMAPVPMVPPGGSYPPPGSYPPSGGFQGGYQGAPSFMPGTVTPATPSPNVPNGMMSPQSGDASGFGQPGQFPGAGNPPTPNVPAGANRAVPDYNDPDLFPRRSPATTPGIDEADDEAQRARDRLKASDNGLNNRAGAALTAPYADEIQFTPPANGNGSRNAQRGIIQTAQHVESASGAAQLRPYGRAQNGHAWFRGLIDFDEQENQWYLIYNPEPDINDPQGGMITLVERPEFSLLPRDNPVTLEGGFDATQIDAEGRPKYQANIVRPLIP